MLKKKKINNFFKKIAKENDIDESSPFGEYFYNKSHELSNLDIDNSFKLDLIKNSNFNIIEKKAFSYFTDNSNSEDFSLEKWRNIYYKIKTSASNKYQAASLAEKYSNDFDKEERERFLLWFKYYSNGEHKKYSGENKKMRIKKKAAYPVGLSANGPYPKNPSFNEQDDNLQKGTIEIAKEKFNKSKNEDQFLEKINLAFDEDTDTKENIEFSEDSIILMKDLKKSINRGVKGVMNKLLVAPVDRDSLKRFMDHLTQLSLEANALTTASTISSVIYKTANKLERDGYSNGANDLKKMAQEVEQAQVQNSEPEEQPASTEQQITPEQQAVQVEEGDAAEQGKDDSGIPRSDEVEPARFEDIETKGPEEGEYDKIIDDDIDISDASNKLDQVAGMLADRRVIRNLAEFDIMLDKLGIASMFPELAESQSKLIDAFGYALTRVTKMMGQLSNAQTIMTKSDSIPGSEE